jgi:hypothetical protein
MAAGYADREARRSFLKKRTKKLLLIREFGLLGDFAHKSVNGGFPC